MKNLQSPKWANAIEEIRQCHLASAGIVERTLPEWKNAFNLLIEAIKDERTKDELFARELKMLDSETETTYSYIDIFEDYFDHLEENKDWQYVIDSCKALIELFKWESEKPSEYKFRIGNALEKAGRLEEAEAFGKEWLNKYPNDLYAVTSNVYLLVELGKLDEAEKLAEQYLSDELICQKETDTFLMAAYKLYDMTDNINAKKRIEQKMADFNSIIQ